MDADRPAQPGDPRDPAADPNRPNETDAVQQAPWQRPEETTPNDSGSATGQSETTEVVSRPTPSDPTPGATDVFRRPEQDSETTDRWGSSSSAGQQGSSAWGSEQSSYGASGGPSSPDPWSGQGQAGQAQGQSGQTWGGQSPSGQSYGSSYSAQGVGGQSYGSSYGQGFGQQGSAAQGYQGQAQGWGGQSAGAPSGPTPYGPGPGGPGGPGGPPQPRRKGRLIAAIVAGVVVLAGIGVGAWLLLMPRYVDTAPVVAQIVRVTQETDELEATAVECPDDVERQPGASFTCTATVVKKPVTYNVKQSEDELQFEVTYTSPTLDPAEIAARVVERTRADYGIEPQNVQCPTGVRYDRNATFTCTATVDAQPVNYVVTQTDGQGDVSMSYDRLVPRADIEAKFAADLTRQVGQQILTQCGPPTQTFVVNQPGQPITCRAENAGDRSLTATFIVIVDSQGNVIDVTR